MIRFPNILTVAKKELRTAFDNPTAYIVLVVFLVLWEFLFLRDAFLIGESSLRNLFDLLPWLSLILLPALSMGSISQEKQDGTLEFLLTQPLTDLEFLLGKFLGLLAFLALALVFVFPLAASFQLFGPIDWGVVCGQYLAGIFFGAGMLAMGIYVSSVCKNQIAALLVTAGVGLILILIGSDFVAANLPTSLAPALSQLSALTHFNGLARGVVDLRDVWYFISFLLGFLALAWLQLLKRKEGTSGRTYRRSLALVAVFLLIVVGSDLLSARIPGRLDLTQSHSYSLSAVTKETLSALPDTVTVTLYASNELPTQLQPTLRDIKDTLRDYQTLGGKKFVFLTKDPTDPKVAEEATGLGVREIQFNIISKEGYQVKKGFLGLSVSSTRQEVLPFVPSTDQLEYQLTSAIIGVTAKNKKQVAFLAGHGEKDPTTEYAQLSRELEKQFNVTSLTITSSTKQIPDDVAALVVAGPSAALDTHTRDVLTQYVNRGGPTLFLIDAVSIDMRNIEARVNPNSLAYFLPTYGVTVHPDLAYDFRSNATISLGGQQGATYYLPYPLWIRAIASDHASPISGRIPSLILPWTSSLLLNERVLGEQHLTATKLYVTTDQGGSQVNSFTLKPQDQLPTKDLREQLLAVSILGTGSDKQKPIRLVVVGNSNFLLDQFTQNTAENLAFGVETVDWLAQQTSLTDLSLKQGESRKMVITNPTFVTVVKYGNLAGVVLLPLLFGAFRLHRRRNLRKQSYVSASQV